VVCETMACGSPVVSTDCNSGPREILENGKHGKLVGVGDEAAMADAIAEVLKSPSAARQRIPSMAEYSVDAGVERTLAVVERVCG